MQLNTEKEVLKNYGYDTIDMQISRAEDEVKRKMSKPDYKNSSEYNEDITALTTLKNQVAENKGLNASTLAGLETEYREHVKRKLLKVPQLNSVVQEQGGGNVKFLYDTPEIRKKYADFLKETEETFFKSRLSAFSFYEYPELYKLADDFGIKYTNEDKMSRYSFQPNKELVSVVDENEVKTSLDSDKNANNQTDELLNKKQKDTSIVLNTEQKEFQSTYSLDKEGIDKLLKLKADVGKTPEKFIEDLKYYYPNKEITDSIKNQISNYFENKDTQAAIEEQYGIPKDKAIGDDFVAATIDLAKKGGSKFKNMLSAMASKGSVDGIVNAAKRDYYDTDADAETKEFILDELKKYLKLKNYSEGLIKKEIEKIKNPANLKKVSGGLMSKQG